jgi:hypothetical protein
MGEFYTAEAQNRYGDEVFPEGFTFRREEMYRDDG